MGRWRERIYPECVSQSASDVINVLSMQRREEITLQKSHVHAWKKQVRVTSGRKLSQVK